MEEKIIFTVPRKRMFGLKSGRKEISMTKYTEAVNKIKSKVQRGKLYAEIFIGEEVYDDCTKDSYILNTEMNKVNAENICACIHSIHNNFIEITPEDKKFQALFDFLWLNKIIPKAHMRYKTEKSIFKGNNSNISEIITFDIVIPRIPSYIITPEIQEILYELEEYPGVKSYVEKYRKIKTKTKEVEENVIEFRVSTEED